MESGAIAFPYPYGNATEMNIEIAKNLWYNLSIVSSLFIHIVNSFENNPIGIEIFEKVGQQPESKLFIYTMGVIAKGWGQYTFFFTRNLAHGQGNRESKSACLNIVPASLLCSIDNMMFCIPCSVFVFMIN